MKGLTVEELKILYDFLGNINYYEIMAILCKNYDSEFLQENHDKIIKVIFKLGKIVEPI